MFKKYAALWHISTGHFDPYARVRGSGVHRRKPLEEILVEHSSSSRVNLKKRLYEAELKRPTCELCGQGELWRGRRMGLILDHINGVSDDNRLENLRIVCPNCAATLETHCARGRRVTRAKQNCLRCGTSFPPLPPVASSGRRTRSSFGRSRRSATAEPPAYGVSDNAIRKWIRAYERELDRAA